MIEMLSLTDFVHHYDKTGAVILLEGKRNVRNQDKPLLENLGTLLCSKMQNARFRSGNASGSDELFARGVAKVDAGRMEVILPYTGHRRKKASEYSSQSLDNINLAAEPEVTYHTRSNRHNEKLINDFVDGINNHVTIKAAYLLRDTVKVIGTRSGIPKAAFAIFYDDPDKPESGGTGHTMMVCKNAGVPFVDQEVWKLWLDGIF
jgi:hypothetical protein